MKIRMLSIILIVMITLNGLLALSPVMGEPAQTVLAVPERAALMVTAIEPNEAPNDLDTAVVISGTGFEVTPKVFLGEAELSEVTWVSETELEAVMPWGMDPGVYSLTVENPDGETASLVDAFTVTQGIDMWTSGGPYGGFVEFLSLGDELGEIVYAIVNNVGLFRSRNGGESWDWLFLTGYSDRVEVDPMNPDRLYISKAIHQDRNLYRSEDGGDTWAAMPSPDFMNDENNKYAYVSPHDGTLFVAHYDFDIPCSLGCGLLRFDENNQTWILLEEEGLLDDTTSASAVAFDPDDPDIIYTGLVGGLVLKSVDGGETWSSLGGPPTDDFNEMRVNPVTREIWVTCGGRNSSLPGGLYRYNGSEWISMYTSPQLFAIVTDIIIADAPNVDTQQIWIAAHTDGLLTSDDGGGEWTRLEDKQYLIDHPLAIALNPAQPETIFSGTPDGIVRTKDGGKDWQMVNGGLTGIIAHNMAVSPHDPAVVYGVGSEIIFGSADGGTQWQKLLPAAAGVILVDPDGPYRVVNAANGVLNIAEDGWLFDKHIPIPLPPGMDSDDYFAVSMAMIARSGLWVLGVGYYDRHFPNWNYDGGGGIYLSPDGENWTLVKYGLEGPPTGFAFDPGDDDIIYAITSGGEHGMVIHEGTFLRSTDGGQTWHVSAIGDPPDGDKIAVEPTPPYRIFDGCNVSEDKGVTWTGTACPGDVPPNHLVFLEGSPSILYASTGVGLYRTVDGAQTWQRATGELGTLTVWSLAGIADDDRHIIYVGTAGGVLEVDEFEAQDFRTNQDVLINAGVYRLTTVFSPSLINIYLPFIGQ